MRSATPASRDVGIVIGHTGPEVRAAVGDGARWDLRVTYLEQEAPLGLAHAVMTAADFVRGQPFLMYLGDNVLLEGVTRFVSEFERTRPDAQIFVAQVAEPEHFGVVELEGATRCGWSRSRASSSPTSRSSACTCSTTRSSRRARRLSPSWRGEYEITEAIQWLIDHGKTVRAEMVDGWWKDTGRPEDLLEANRMLLRSRVRGRGSRRSTASWSRPMRRCRTRG